MSLCWNLCDSPAETLVRVLATKNGIEEKIRWKSGSQLSHPFFFFWSNNCDYQSNKRKERKKDGYQYLLRMVWTVNLRCGWEHTCKDSDFTFSLSFLISTSPLVKNACKKLLFWIRMFLCCWQHMASNLSIWFLFYIDCHQEHWWSESLKWLLCFFPVVKSINLFCLAFAQKDFFKKTMHVLLWQY